jgi:Zn-dependent oligopeptidase
LQFQFLELHILEPEILGRLAINKDGQVIPDDLIKKLCNSVYGDEVMFASEQISFAKA